MGVCEVRSALLMQPAGPGSTTASDASQAIQLYTTVACSAFNVFVPLPHSVRATLPGPCKTLHPALPSVSHCSSRF